MDLQYIFYEQAERMQWFKNTLNSAISFDSESKHKSGLWFNVLQSNQKVTSSKYVIHPAYGPNLVISLLEIFWSKTDENTVINVDSGGCPLNNYLELAMGQPKSTLKKKQFTIDENQINIAEQRTKKEKDWCNTNLNQLQNNQKIQKITRNKHEEICIKLA